MSRTSAKEQILTTAARLFYQRGYHAVGVDTIVAESGVAKMTLYRHFPTKDALIAAYLEQANAQFWEWFEGAIAPYAGDPRQQLKMLFAATASLASSPVCLGCTFQMAAGEFPERDHPGHQVALQHKNAVIARLYELAAQAQARDPQSLAMQLFLLMDGVFAATRMFGVENPSVYAAEAANVLIDSQIQ